MGVTAGFLSMKAQFIPLGFAENDSATFGFLRFEKGEIFWEKVKRLEQ